MLPNASQITEWVREQLKLWTLVEQAQTGRRSYLNQAKVANMQLAFRSMLEYCEGKGSIEPVDAERWLAQVLRLR